MSHDPLREQWNRGQLAAHQLDAVVCRLPENVLLLTGFWPLTGFAFAVYPREGPVALIAVDSERDGISPEAAETVRTFGWGVVGATDPFAEIQSHLSELLTRAGLAKARIGYEGSFESVAPSHMAGEVLVPAAPTPALIQAAVPEAVVVDATAAINQMRAHKTPAELVRLRLASEVAALGLAAFRAAYEPGRTESEVAAQVEAAIMAQGTGYKSAQHVRSWAQLMTGPRAAFAYTAHPATSRRTIERGDLGVLELATVVDGYWSDLTRTLVAGAQPSSRQEDMYDALLAAHATVMQNARPGMSGGTIDGLARNEVARRGYGELFLHHTGHGVGLRYHEPYPFLHPANQAIVSAGMVATVEPGLYLEGFGGMRLEENVVAGEGGFELLSTFDTSLAL